MCAVYGRTRIYSEVIENEEKNTIKLSLSSSSLHTVVVVSCVKEKES